jgi:hypothetical protein
VDSGNLEFLKLAEGRIYQPDLEFFISAGHLNLIKYMVEERGIEIAERHIKEAERRKHHHIALYLASKIK